MAESKAVAAFSPSLMHSCSVWAKPASLSGPIGRSLRHSSSVSMVVSSELSDPESEPMSRISLSTPGKFHL